MRIVRFVSGATRKVDYPTLGVPEVAFAGRSNVGKSSLINSLVGRKNLARTSSTPGRTQIINFFSVDDRLLLVDLPGYGYAKVPERIRGHWASMIEEYLRESDGLRLVVQIVDARHEPTVLDHQMVEWLRSANRASLIVATKADKVSRNARERTRSQLMERLGVNEVLLFSARTGEGKKELWQVLRRTCGLDQ